LWKRTLLKSFFECGMEMPLRGLRIKMPDGGKEIEWRTLDDFRQLAPVAMIQFANRKIFAQRLNRPRCLLARATIRIAAQAERLCCWREAKRRAGWQRDRNAAGLLRFNFRE